MPEIKQFPKLRIAFLTSVGPFGQAIPAGLQKLFAWVAANKVQPIGPSLALFPDDPGEVPAEKLRSEIGIPVGPEVEGSGEVQTKEIGGFEAATTVYHARQEIDRAYGELYGWLHQQGYRDAGTPLETYLSTGEEFSAEIVIPIVKVEAESAPMKAAPNRPVRKRASARKKTARKKSASKKAARKKSAAKRRASK
jgi:DNA gyrase inhibitor GyrI